jgi:hypothetical protein
MAIAISQVRGFIVVVLIFPRVLAQALHGGEVDALPVWGGVRHLCPTDCRPGALPPLIADATFIRSVQTPLHAFVVPALRQEREGWAPPVLVMPATAKAWATRPVPGSVTKEVFRCVLPSLC